MVVRPSIPLWIVVLHLRERILAFLLAGVVATMVHLAIGEYWGLLPMAPFSIVGITLGLFLSFRTSSAYDRWWEGRKLWGAMVNTSRSFARQAITLIEAPAGASAEVQARVVSLRKQLVHGQIVYVHALKAHCRGQDVLSDSDVLRCADQATLDALGPTVNRPNAIVLAQSRLLAQAVSEGLLHELRFQRLDASLVSLLDIQGGCERIRNTPIPPSYTAGTRKIVLAYGLLLPFGIASELGVLTPLLSTAVAMLFVYLDDVGRLVQDPFLVTPNGLPLQALSTTIEIDLRQDLGETALPAPVVDVGGILL